MLTWRVASLVASVTWPPRSPACPAPSRAGSNAENPADIWFDGVTRLAWTFSLVVLWGIAFAFIVAHVRGAVLGLMLLGGFVALINAVAVASMAPRVAAW